MKNQLLNLQKLGSQETLTSLSPLNNDELMNIKGGSEPIHDAVSIFVHCLVYHTFQSFYHCIQDH